MLLLAEPVLGAKLIEATIVCAHKPHYGCHPYEEKIFKDGENLVIVGQQSRHPFNDLVVEVSEDGKIFKRAINPEKNYLYVRLVLAEHPWPKCPEKFKYGTVVFAQKHFKECLLLELRD